MDICRRTATQRRRRNQLSERDYIERHNRRLCKRMCPYRAWICATPTAHAPPSRHAAQDKTLNLHSTVFRHAKPLFLSPPPPPPLTPPPTPAPPPAFSFFLCSLYLFPSFSRSVSFLSLRLKAAHNSRSQFSISADFSIRLRGAAVLTRGTRQLLLAASSCCPPFSCTNTEMS